MSGFLNNLHDRNQQFRERIEERREALQERRDAFQERREHGGRHRDDYGRGLQHLHHRDDDPRTQYSQQGGYGAPPGPPPGRGPAAFASQGGLDRHDFASDADIERMVSSGTFGGAERGAAHGRYDAPSGPPPGRGNEYGRHDTPSGPPPGQGYSGRYDAPSGPPPARGQQAREDYAGDDRQNQYGSQPQDRHQYESSGYRKGQDNAPSGAFGSQQGPQSDYGKGQGNAPSGAFSASRDEGDQYRSQQGPQPGYGSSQSNAPSGAFGTTRNEEDQYRSGYGGTDRQNQYGSQQGPQAGYNGGQGNAPSGAFGASRDGEDQYHSGYSGPRNNRDDGPGGGEAASYYRQQGQGDRYGNLAGIAQEHGQDDPEVYRRATQGLQDRIQTQAQSRRPNDEDDYKAHVDAHRKAYGDDDHGPMDADAIGSAAAIEAIKQAAAAGSSNAPKGAFSAAGSSSKAGPAAQEGDEEETSAARAGGSGGLQDKLMGLAMSHAGKLFDKKNAGASGGDQSQDKAQAMQSAAATAMQLFTKYQSGKLDSSDMSSVMSLAMKML